MKIITRLHKGYLMSKNRNCTKMIGNKCGLPAKTMVENYEAAQEF